MNKVKIFLLDIVFGALSWTVCPLVSDRFEPFDTSLGLVIGQIILSVAALCISLRSNYIGLLILILAMHFGQNIYAYAFGGSEQRAWIGLGLLVNLIFLVIPLGTGVLCILIKRKKSKGKK